MKCNYQTGRYVSLSTRAETKPTLYDSTPGNVYVSSFVEEALKDVLQKHRNLPLTENLVPTACYAQKTGNLRQMQNLAQYDQHKLVGIHGILLSISGMRF